MKPTPQISSNPRLPRNDGRALRDHGSLPLSDCSYQSTAEAVDRSSAIADNQMAEIRSFRRISSEFFISEAGREYLKEAIFFAWITGVAAWPVSVMLYQLLRWMI